MEHSRHLDEVAAAAPSGEGVPGGASAAQVPLTPCACLAKFRQALRISSPLEYAAAKWQPADVPDGTPVMMQAGATAWGASLGNSGLGWAMSSMGLSRGGAAAATTGTIGGAPSALSNGPAAPLAAPGATARPGVDASGTSPRPAIHHEPMGGQPARPGKVYC